MVKVKKNTQRLTTQKNSRQKASRSTAAAILHKRTSKKSGQVPASKAEQLDTLRQAIDGIDNQLLALISERARIARQVGQSKIKSGQSNFYRPDREVSVLRHIADTNPGPLSNDVLLRLFREIMSACLAQQDPLKVAFLGPEGTFTQQAVFKQFGHSIQAVPMPSIDQVFKEVEARVAEFGVVPIENSTEGTVSHTADMFLTSPLKICGEVELRIHQHVLGRLSDWRRAKRVCSHAQSLAQCRGWLDEHLPKVERIACASNAEAARRARDEEGTIAIAGETAAHLYQLKVLVPEIEDRPDNSTRFLIIGRSLMPATGKDRTTVLLSAADTQGSGSLLKLLEPFAQQGITLTRLESRPSRRKKWDYVFLADFAGHVDDAPVKAALAQVQKVASLCKVLGSYPQAVQ
jgi:chorismate mutase/prephenate dehydratase